MFYNRLLKKMSGCNCGVKTMYTASEQNYGDIQEEPGQTQPGKSKPKTKDINAEPRPLGDFITFPNADNSADHKPETWTDPYLRYMDML